MMRLKASFGPDMGIVPGIHISAGAKLMRGTWNTRLYGPLYAYRLRVFRAEPIFTLIRVRLPAILLFLSP